MKETIWNCQNFAGWHTYNVEPKRLHYSPMEPSPDNVSPCNVSTTTSTLLKLKKFWKGAQFTARNGCLKMEHPFVRFI